MNLNLLRSRTISHSNRQLLSSRQSNLAEEILLQDIYPQLRLISVRWERLTSTLIKLKTRSTLLCLRCREMTVLKPVRSWIISISHMIYTNWIWNKPLHSWKNPQCRMRVSNYWKNQTVGLTLELEERTREGQNYLLSRIKTQVKRWDST